MKRIEVGEKLKSFPAVTWNRLVEAHEASQGGLRPGIDVAGRQAGSQVPVDQGGMVVHVLNSTGAALKEFSVIGVGDPLFTPPATDLADASILGGVQFEAVSPLEASHRSAFALTLEPIGVERVGRAILPGATWARVNLLTENDRVCGVKDSQTQMLEGGTGSTPILWKPAAATGEKWCVVQLGGGAGGDSTMLVVTVQSPVAALTSTFTVPQGAYRVVFGDETRSSITVHNTRNEALAPGDTLPVWKRAADADYEPDRAGGTGSGSLVVHYELIEDMALSDTAKLAKPVLANGTIDAGASAFYVVDQGQQFVGRAAWTDAVGSEHGFRGYALKFADDYSGGVPGYRIISQDGPLRDIVVTLNADGDDGGGPFTATPVDTDYYGNPFNGRRPEADSGTGSFSVYDPHGVAEEAKQGEKWLVKYNEDSDQYDLHYRLELAPFGRIRGKINSVTITRSLSSMTLTECEAVEGREPPATVTAEIPDYAKMDIPSSYTGWVYARWNEKAGTDETDRWDTDSVQNLHWCLRGKVGFDATKEQVFFNDGAAETDMQWQEVVAAEVMLADPAPTVTLSNPTATSLRVKIDGQKRAVKILASAAATAISFQGDITGDDCT